MPSDDNRAGDSPSVSGEASPSGRPPESLSKKKRALVYAAVGIMLVQLAAGAFVVARDKRARRAREGDVDTLYQRAEAFAARGERLRALDELSTFRLATSDPARLKVAADLERKIRAAPQLSLAKKQMNAKNWTMARYHLQQVLALVPGHLEASALSAEVEAHVAPASTPPASKAIATPQPTVAPDADAPSRAPTLDRRPRGRRRQPRQRPPPAKARLFIGSTPRAKLYVDGRLLGMTPQDDVELEAGRHSISLEGKNVIPYRSSITVGAGQRKALVIQLELKRPAPTTIAAKPAPPARPTAARSVPRLRLPATVTVPIYRDGKRSKVLRVVCVAIERTVSNALGVSAAETTAPFWRHIYANRRGSDSKATLYPRTMGYLIAQAILGGKRASVGDRLVRYQKTGRMEALMKANWRPRSP